MAANGGICGGAIDTSGVSVLSGEVSVGSRDRDDDRGGCEVGDGDKVGCVSGDGGRGEQEARQRRRVYLPVNPPTQDHYTDILICFAGGECSDDCEGTGG